MARYMPAVLVGLLVLVAGCAGVLPTPAEPTASDRPTTEPPTDQLAPAPTDGGPSTGGAAMDANDLEASRMLGPQPAFGGAGLAQSAGTAGTITVSGVGQVSVDPDLALVHVTVQADAETADAAREAVARDVRAMRSAIRELGIPDDDVRTTAFYLSPRYDYARDRQELIGYQAVHSFQIRADVDQAGAVVDTAVGNGADRVDNVQFTITEETRRSLRAEALTNAVADARSDADAIAAATDTTITGLHSASTSGPVVTPYVGRLEAVADDGRTPTTFDTGPVTVTAYVTVSFAVD